MQETFLCISVFCIFFWAAGNFVLFERGLDKQKSKSDKVRLQKNTQNG